MKNALESFGNRADHMGEKTSKLEDRNLEVIQVEEERKLRFKKMKKIYKNNMTLLKKKAT